MVCLHNWNIRMVGDSMNKKITIATPIVAVVLSIVLYAMETGDGGLSCPVFALKCKLVLEKTF